MPAGKFSAKEMDATRAAAYASVARQNEEHALIKDALKFYARHMESAARDPDTSLEMLSHYAQRARLAEKLAKEF